MRGRAVSGSAVRPGPYRRRLAALLAVAAAAAGCSTLARVEGTELVYRRVTPAVAFEILRDSPEALILDLRPAAAFRGPEGHLRRARNVPLSELADRVEELGGYRDHTFLVYCGGDERCAVEGMRLLVEHGCAYAVLIDGRLDGWAQSGYAKVEEQEPGAGRSTGAPPSGL